MRAKSRSGSSATQDEAEHRSDDFTLVSHKYFKESFSVHAHGRPPLTRPAPGARAQYCAPLRRPA